MKKPSISAIGLILAAGGLFALSGCAGIPSSPGPNGVQHPNFVKVLTPQRQRATPANLVPPVSISTKFNGTEIAAGNWLWISAVCRYSGSASPITFHLQNASVSFTANGAAYSIPIPNATLVLSSACRQASTSYDPVSNTWQTVAPLRGSGNVFLGGAAWRVPVDLPGGIQPVTLQGVFTTDHPGESLQWRWSAAVYDSLTDALDRLGVKPIDDDHHNPWHNSDHAGTPEAFKDAVTRGAMGGGGANYTGGLTPGFVVAPGASSTDPLFESVVIDGKKGGTLTVGRFTIEVPRNAFDGSATVGIQVPDPSVLQCNLSITPASANRFAAPVVLETDYSGCAVPDPHALVELWLDESAGLWREVPGSTVDVADQLVRVHLKHFSKYGVANGGRAGW